MSRQSQWKADKVYEAYKIPEDEIAYPTVDFIGDLLRLKQGESTVLNDRPEKHYYVAYVVKRMPTFVTASGKIPWTEPLP